MKEYLRHMMADAEEERQLSGRTKEIIHAALDEPKHSKQLSCVFDRVQCWCTTHKRPEIICRSGIEK